MTDKQKQCLLTYLGYDTGGVDGIWGDKSRQATEEFQADFGLEPDGVFGNQTKEAIINAISSEEVAPKESSGSFWDEIEYFDHSEFACPCPRCGGFQVEPQEQIVRLSDQTRKHFGAPMCISSGVRCQAHNDELPGSVPNSKHVQGKAVDFRIQGRTADQILAYVRTLPGITYAYKIDNDYVHMNTV